MKKNKIYITPDQLDNIIGYCYYINSISAVITKMCNEEKPDIKYGFELGSLQMGMINNFLDFKKLLDQIHNQNE